jgi:anthranilate/para-aminobenzoate synthase component II
MIILIDNYDSFTWNLYHFLGDLGAETVVHRNDKISVGQVMSARPEAIVISPGPGTPSQAGIIIDLIKEASARSRFLACAWVCRRSAKLWRGCGARAHPDAWQALEGASRRQGRLQGAAAGL